jgi:hypothetical protein
MGFFKRRKNQEKLCPNCKKPVAEGTAFCDACGLRVSPPPACSRCELPLAPDTNFCEACGTPVGAPPVSQDPGNSSDAEPALPKKGKSTKSRKGKKATKLKKDAFVLPSMVIPEPAVEKPVENGPPSPSDETARSREAEGGKKPVPRVHDAVTARTGSAGPRVSRKKLVVGGLLVAGLILAGVFLAGHFPGTHKPSSAVSPNPIPAAAVPAPETGYPPDLPTGRTVTGPSLVPGPTQVPPESYLIWLQAERDPITNIVTVIYDGGKGQRAVRDVRATLTRSDGKIVTQIFRPETVGEGASLQGTRYVDRLEVVITYNSGGEYKVIDRLFSYKQRDEGEVL